MGRKKVENSQDGSAVEVEKKDEVVKKLDEVLPNDEGGTSTDLSGEDHSVENTTAGIKTFEEPKAPKIEDPDWLDYVMSLFEPDELDDGYPKANGLRRIVRKVFGPIIKAYPHTVQIPTPQNLMRATVEFTVVVLNKKQLDQDEVPYEMHFADVADAYIDNIKGDVFASFPPAIASTRAEVRALRKMLNIGIVAAEELPDPNFSKSVAGEIPDSLVNKIDSKCGFLNINVMKFINMGRGKPGKPAVFGSIKEVSWALGQKMFSALNVYQQDISKGGTDVIPAKIVGYNPNWRTEDQ